MTSLAQLARPATLTPFVLHTEDETLHARATRQGDVPGILGTNGRIHRADRPCARCLRDLAVPPC